MNIVITYRPVGISSHHQRLNCVNPSPNIQKNGLRIFHVDSNDIGTIDVIFAQSLLDIPTKDWELHYIDIPDLRLHKFNSYSN